MSMKTIVVTAAAVVGLLVAVLLYRMEHQPEARKQDDALPAAPARRIAVISGAAEEILFGIGADDRIVGTAGFSIYTRDNNSIPKLGGPSEINFERLTRVAPDLIVAQSSDHALERYVSERSIPFLKIQIEQISDIPNLARTLGARVGAPREGERLARRIETELETVRRVAAEDPVPCFAAIDRTPGQMTQILTTGSGTFINELLKIAGCKNVFGDLTASYPVISKESLSARAPEVILELKPLADTAVDPSARLIADWQALPSIPAVAENRIVVITHDAALTPGPRIAETARLIAEALHPDADIGTTATDAK